MYQIILIQRPLLINIQFRMTASFFTLSLIYINVPNASLNAISTAFCCAESWKQTKNSRGAGCSYPRLEHIKILITHGSKNIFNNQHSIKKPLSTSKNVLFPGHSHLLTTGGDDPIITYTVKGHQHQWLAGGNNPELGHF